MASLLEHERMFEETLLTLLSEASWTPHEERMITEQAAEMSLMVDFILGLFCWGFVDAVQFLATADFSPVIQSSRL